MYIIVRLYDSISLYIYTRAIVIMLCEAISVEEKYTRNTCQETREWLQMRGYQDYSGYDGY